MTRNPLPLHRRKALTVFVPSGNAPEDTADFKALQEQGPFVTLVPAGMAAPKEAIPGAWTVRVPPRTAYFETVLGHAAKVVARNSSVHAIAERAKATLARPLPQDTRETLTLCAVADLLYLPFFFALVDNLRNVHRGPLEIHLLGLGEAVKETVEAQFGASVVHVHSLNDVWSPEELPRILERSTALQAFSSKPAILRHVRKISSAPIVMLMDLDLYFYRSPAHLHRAFDGADALLFPQWSDRFTWARLHGVINSGFFCVKKGSQPFLEWWTQACLNQCESDVGAGLFLDQGYIDQALATFEGLQIYRGRDENIAGWNLKTLDVRWGTEGPCVDDGRPVGSFHAAGSDEPGFFETKYVWDQITALFSVLADPDECAPLFTNTLEQQRRHWPELDRALRLRHLAGTRLRVETGAVTPDWTESVTRGAAARFFCLLDKLHARYAQWRQHGPVDDTANDKWVALQRDALFPK